MTSQITFLTSVHKIKSVKASRLVCLWTVIIPLKAIMNSSPDGDSTTPESSDRTIEEVRQSISLSQSMILGTLQQSSSSSTAEPGPSSPRRRTAPPNSSSLDIHSSSLPIIQKSRDDTDDSPAARERHHYTPHTLSQLLGARLDYSPSVSRQQSYNIGNENLIRKQVAMEGSSLSDHLYTRGLLGGRHSDICVIAFDHRYNLHRIILDRAPFFQMALTEPWIESRAKEITLHPEAADATITQDAFELALRKIYGCDIQKDLDGEAVGLFAVGCWLELQEIIDAATESILRNLTPDNLGSTVRLVTNNYYGQHGARILASAKAMLCRDGWDMALRHWDSIPAEIVREVVSSDGFFVTSEWERWNHARRLYERRLKLHSLDFGFSRSTSKKLLAPRSIMQWLPRFHFGTQTPSQPETRSHTPADTEEDKWFSLYAHVEVEPLSRLIDYGVYYIHLEYEHLQYIKGCCDTFGLPIVPEQVILNALFMQLELRQHVVNAKTTDLELGIVTPLSTDQSTDSLLEMEDQTKGETPTQPWNKKFYIPSSDCHIVMGGSPQPIVTTGSNSSGATDMPARSTAVAGDAEWTVEPETRTNGDPNDNTHGRPPPLGFTRFPPFRFSASFPSPRFYKEKKKLYSRTIFYAGSLFNVYLQKQRSNRKVQLGVYLHRAKERDISEDLNTSRVPATVDERIGLLEREMLLRGDQSTFNGRVNRLNRLQPQQSLYMGRLSTNQDNPQFSGTLPHLASPFGISSTDFDINLDDSDGSEETQIVTEHADEDESDSPGRQHFVAPRVPTVPPYRDARPKIRTYFKICSPSKAGRLLSIYESAPDEFECAQSWGWRSSSLMLDEGLSESSEEEGQRTKSNSGVLRFSIVLGNL
jgi:hypothetical protein